MANKRIQLLDGSDNVFPENPSPIRDTILAWKAIDGTSAAGNPHFELRNIYNDADLASLGIVFTNASGGNSFFRLTNYDGSRNFLILNDTPKATSLTISASTAGAGSATTMYFKRVGNFVFVEHQGIMKLSTGSARSMGTAPEGYRPISNVFFDIPLLVSNSVSGHARCEISTNGSIKIVSSYANNAEYYFSTVYMTNNDYPS